MITEQRLRFEAKHPPEDGVEWSNKAQRYTPHFLPDMSEESRDCLLIEVAKQNARFEGYQSALEDRQGETIGKVRVSPHGTCVFEKAKGVYLAYGMHDVFTSPQPAQPDTGNAIIEALIERITERFRAELAAVQAAEWTVYKLPPMSEVLRQMFGIMEPEQHEAAVKEYALQAVNNAILALRKGA